MEARFTVNGAPQGKARPRFARAGDKVVTYTPTETSAYEEFVRWSYWKENKGERLSGALEASIVGFFPIPKSETKKRKALMEEGKIFYTKKIDCDNLAKIILDALNGVAYDDDKQICRLQVDKRYGTEPRVEVVLRELEIV